MKALDASAHGNTCNTFEGSELRLTNRLRLVLLFLFPRHPNTSWGERCLDGFGMTGPQNIPSKHRSPQEVSGRLGIFYYVFLLQNKCQVVRFFSGFFWNIPTLVWVFQSSAVGHGSAMVCNSRSDPIQEALTTIQNTVSKLTAEVWFTHRCPKRLQTASERFGQVVKTLLRLFFSRGKFCFF